MNPPSDVVGKLVNFYGDFGVIVSCKYDKEVDCHLIRIKFIDKQFGLTFIDATWTSVIPFLMK